MDWDLPRTRVLAAAAMLAWTLCHAGDLAPTPAVAGARLYVLDCGTIISDYPETFALTRDEVGNSNFAVMCYLIVHPKGTLLWDTGLPDRWLGRPLYENPYTRHLYNLKQNTLVGQLADIGYTPAMIDYLSLSHSHYDHSGNANAFAASTWLVSRQEWNYMFPAHGAPLPRGFDEYAHLKTARTVFVADDHDVFGDGSVIIRQAAGHTPGHSVLQVNLKNSGPVILAGDLYHYPQEMTLGRMPAREQSTGTPQSRSRVEGLARQVRAQIWIAHDMELFRRLRREPAWYD
jgi:glyoxylase-like metal-dependent hydrolase (beta-lactamase superfamily II)